MSSRFFGVHTGPDNLMSDKPIVRALIVHPVREKPLYYKVSLRVPRPTAVSPNECAIRGEFVDSIVLPPNKRTSFEGMGSSECMSARLDERTPLPLDVTGIPVEMTVYQKNLLGLT